MCRVLLYGVYDHQSDCIHHHYHHEEVEEGEEEEVFYRLMMIHQIIIPLTENTFRKKGRKEGITLCHPSIVLSGFITIGTKATYRENYYHGDDTHTAC